MEKELCTYAVPVLFNGVEEYVTDFILKDGRETVEPLKKGEIRVKTHYEREHVIVGESDSENNITVKEHLIAYEVRSENSRYEEKVENRRERSGWVLCGVSVEDYIKYERLCAEVGMRTDGSLCYCVFCCTYEPFFDTHRIPLLDTPSCSILQKCGCERVGIASCLCLCSICVRRRGRKRS